MSLDKKQQQIIEFLAAMRPPANMDPQFPFFDQWVDSGWSGSSPSGFDPAYFEAEISLPEPS
jgi:hypothetical protein